MVAEVRVVADAVVADRVAESVNSMQKARVHSRKGSVKYRRKPRRPVTGAGTLRENRGGLMKRMNGGMK